MRYSFTGKDFTISEGMKEKTIQKVGRLERMLPEDCEVFITMSVEKITNKVEVTIPLKKRTLRAENGDMDMLTAIDKVVDSLERQMSKYKGQLNHKAKKDASFKEEYRHMFEDTGSSEKEDEHKLVFKKSKKFALKPMDIEEAAMNMDLLGHSFFVFRNANTDEVNVVYRRNDNAYGLIEPEF